MLAINQNQLDQITKSSFFYHLEKRLSLTEGAEIELMATQRDILWDAAHKAQTYGIVSLEGCLTLCHLYFELGFDCTQTIPAFATVLSDSQASELDKIDALWSIRTALLLALQRE